MSGNVSRSTHKTITQKSVNGPSQFDKLAPFRHFHQPIFLFRSNRELLESNLQGKQAIAKHWVGLSRNRLDFNSQENNAYVNHVIRLLCENSVTDDTQNARSERFVLRNLDMIYRAYTISLESRHTKHLILSIQGDLTYTPQKINTLANAFSLTNSETRIVKMMVAGMKPKEIAYEAGISLNTVRTHLRTLYAKMQVRDYNEALTQAVRLMV